MSERMKTTLIVIAAVIIGTGAFTYGALTAPRPAKSAPVASTTPQPVKVDLDQLLQTEQPTILGVLTTAYPKISTDYTIDQGKLFDQGEWYGTTLTYRGSDTMNRDTLRVLLQKKQGVWVLRTTPPEPLLSKVEFPEVPKTILDTINKPVSLPAGDTSPSVNAAG